MTGKLVLITRPREQAEDFTALVEAAGFEAFCEPVLDVAPLEFTPPENRQDFQAILLTSANAVPVRAVWPECPVFTVGPETARAARAAGYVNVTVTGGNAESLTDAIALVLKPKAGKLLYLRGQDISYPLAQKLAGYGFETQERIIYRTAPVLSFSKECQSLIKSGQVGSVIFMSRKTAENFNALAKKHGLEAALSGTNALCLSGAITGSLENSGWNCILAAEKPDRDGMLKLLRERARADQRVEEGLRSMSDGDENMSNAEPKALDNAEQIIERFGGIRPMASKVKVPVTTVQGWKKRNVIPGTRRADIVQAAQDNNINIEDLVIEGVHANENTAAIKAAALAAVKTETAKPAARKAEVGPEEKPDSELKAVREEKAAPSSAAKKPADSAKAAPVIAAPRAEIKSDTRVRAEAQEPVVLQPGQSEIIGYVRASERRAVRRSLWLSILLVTATAGFGAYILRPSVQSVAEHGTRLAVVEGTLDQVSLDVDSLKADRESFLGGLVPDSIRQKVDEMVSETRGLQSTVSELMTQANEAVQGGVAAGNVQTAALAERIAKLEERLGAVAGSTAFAGFMTRIQEMKESAPGQEQLGRAMADLRAVVQGTQLEGSDDNAFNQALAGAREQSEALGAAFEGVSNDDLKAAALLLALTQFRESLNRDEQPFGEDLAVLQQMIGDDNPGLKASLEQLAPYAQSGVLSSQGLQESFKGMAGDVVVASLKGEDVSIADKAKARLGDVLQLRRNGELVTGTETQAQLDHAQTLLNQGDVEGAVVALQSLDGEAAIAAQPWIASAAGTIDAQKAGQAIAVFLQQQLSVSRAPNTVARPQAISPENRVIKDEESGINILPPASGFKNFSLETP